MFVVAPIIIGRMRVWQNLVLLAAVVSLTSAGNGQDVRERGSGIGSSLRRYERTASEKGHSSFPKFRDGDPGTIVDLHFDFNDLDITFVRTKKIPIEELLDDARRFAKARNQPEADFITFKGNKTMLVDVEFNDYLPEGRKRTVEFDIDALMEQVSVMKSLEKPIWIVVDPSEVDTTIIRKRGEPDRTIDEVEFFIVDGNRTGAVIIQSAAVHWYAYPLLFFLLILFVAIPVSLFVTLMRMPIPAVAEGEVELKTPDEVQQEYEQGRKKVWLPFLPLLVIFPLFVVGSELDFLKQPLRVLPSGWSQYAMVIPLLMIVPTIAVVIVRRRRMAQAGVPAPKEDADTRSLKLMTNVMIWPFALGMLLLIVPRLVPGVREYIPVWFIRSLPIILPAMLILPLVIGGLLMKRRNNASLPADHPYRLFAVETAARVGAKVRDLRVYDVDYVNAMVTLGGNVVLTKGLMEKMEPEEIKAIIAHEIGHQRSKHVRKFFLLSLCILIPLMGIQIWLFETFPNIHPLLRSPIVTFPLAFFAVHGLLGRRRRDAEHEADLFAVEIVDDPELVIRSLNKMAHINQTPTNLIGIDEKLSTHPSISKREKVIREFYQGESQMNNSTTENS